VEYRAVQQEMEKKAAEGYRARAIYEELVAARRLPSATPAFVTIFGARLNGYIAPHFLI
jgi:hypothetical protein